MTDATHERRGEGGEDGELLRRFVRQGDHAAFAELVERNVGLVYAAALRQLGGSVHRAREVAQLVFIDLARKAPALARRDDLAGWLYTSAHYAAAKLKRGEQRREAREQEAHMMHEISAGGADEAEWERLRPVLDDAMLELSEADRAALLMRFFQGRRFAEIARGLALSEDAARMRVDRALEKLRVLLGRRGITSTGAALAAALASPALVAAPAGLAAMVTGTALAGAGMGAGATVATGFFMSKSTWVLTTVATVAIGVAVFEAGESRRAAASLAALSREQSAVRAQLRAAERKSTEADERAVLLAQQQEATQRELVSARAGRSILAGAAPQPAQRSSSQGIITLGPSLSSDPAEARRLGRLRNIESMEVSNRPLHALLKLTPVQVDQLKAMLVEDMDRRDALLQQRMAAARAQIPPLDRAALQAVGIQAVDENHAEFKQRLRAAFGDQALQTYERFIDTRVVRDVTSRMVSDLFHTEAPLTVEQTEQLVEILARNSRDAAGKVDLAAMNAESAELQAQAVLSPAQLPALRRAQQESRLKWVTGPLGLTPGK